MVETVKDFEFFKVFLPEFSSHELVIPPAFIDMLEKPLPNETLLLDEIGRIWSVETKTEDTEERYRVLFKKGWEVFANDQSLEFGDFLVFSYDGDSRFSVTIFSKDGCKKYLGVDTTTDRSRVSVEKEPVDVFTKPERREDCGNRANRNRKHVSIKKEPKDSGKRTIRNRKHVSVKEVYNVLVNDEPDNVSSSKTESEHREISRGKFNRSRDPYDLSWVTEKKHKGFEEPVYKPKSPHFVRTITHASLHQLEIPITLLKSNGIELEEDIELCDENGKKWEMKIVKDDRGIKTSRESWICFCKSHKLMKQNKCLFEFIVEMNGRCNEIHVRIFREGLLTCIAKSGYQVLAM